VEAARQILQQQTQAGAEWPVCELVFVTAYDQDALDAFNQGALDYWLNRLPGAPSCDLVSCPKTAGRALPLRAHGKNRVSARQLVERPTFLKWIPAATGTTLQMWPVEQVLFFSAEDKYTRAATAQSEALLRKTIRELVAELDPDVFWQIHRGTIVNARAIEKIHRSMSGALSITLRGSTERFEVSRTHGAVQIPS